MQTMEQSIEEQELRTRLEDAESSLLMLKQAVLIHRDHVNRSWEDLSEHQRAGVDLWEMARTVAP